MENFYLASSNTTEGFCNHFDSINPEDNSFTYVIKGGSGTGKSTFMKKVGRYFEEKGFDIEYFCCSSDVSSLDGVRIVQKNVSIVDGTSPHITEAVLPQVKDKIINVGDFISPDIRKYKSQIEQILPKKKQCFDLCYKYLSCVRKIMDIEKSLAKNDNDFVNKKTDEVLSHITNFKKQTNFQSRQLYLSYIDTKGLHNLKTKNKFKTIIEINAGQYMLGFEVLNKISNMLKIKKIEHIELLSPLGHEFVEGIYFPSNGTLVFNNYKKGSLKNEKIFSTLLSKAGKCVEDARSFHKQIEKYYISHMDFDKLTTLREKTIKEIENM